MKSYFEFGLGCCIRIKRIWFNVGWFTSDPFNILKIEIGSRVPDYPARAWYKDHWSILYIQFLYFVMAFGIDGPDTISEAE